MPRRLTALFSGLEALLVVAIGVAIPLAPLTLVWAVHFGFAVDWVVFWRAAVDVWLLGHGVDVTFVLDPELAAALGMPAAAEPVRVTIALLGFALLTLLLGVRAGGRIDETGHPVIGTAVGVGVVASLSVALTWSVLHDAARPSLVQAALLPGLVFGAGIVVGLLRGGGAPGRIALRLRDRLDDITPALRVGGGAALRAGIGALALTVAVAAVLVAALIVVRFATLIGLYEALHTEVVGGIALTLAQLALLPNLVLWAAAWLFGPGFAIGVGSSVSPVGTSLGPVPALPVFGALPTGEPTFGFLGLLVPVVAGFLAGAAVRPALARSLDRVGPLTVLGVGVAGGVVAGALAGFLAAASGGSAGPGRLAEVGPDPLVVALVAAAEFGVAITLGLAAASRMPSRARR